MIDTAYDWYDCPAGRSVHWLTLGRQFSQEEASVSPLKSIIGIDFPPLLCNALGTKEL